MIETICNGYLVMQGHGLILCPITFKDSGASVDQLVLCSWLISHYIIPNILDSLEYRYTIALGVSIVYITSSVPNCFYFDLSTYHQSDFYHYTL
jgi:hypothetical protein